MFDQSHSMSDKGHSDASQPAAPAGRLPMAVKVKTEEFFPDTPEKVETEEFFTDTSEKSALPLQVSMHAPHLSSLSDKGHSNASQLAAASKRPDESESMQEHLDNALACLPAYPWPPPMEITPWRLQALEARQTAQERTWPASVHRLHTITMSYTHCLLEGSDVEQFFELESMLLQCIKVIATKVVINTHLLPSDLNEPLKELVAVSKEIAVLKHFLKHEAPSIDQVQFIMKTLDAACERLHRSKQTLAELRGQAFGCLSQQAFSVLGD